MADTGLLCAMCSDDVQYQIVNGNYSINEGSIMENMFAQQLKSNGFNLYYFDKQKVGEVDFIVEQYAELVPVEIKSGKDYKSHRALNNLLAVDEYKLKESIVKRICWTRLCLTMWLIICKYANGVRFRHLL